MLCGATANLTGEHKIKASLIRHEFGSRTTVFLGKDGPKFAQSPKSKVYHFKSKICQACNSSRTQAGDHAFDLLHRCLVRLRDEGSELTNESHTPNCTFPDCVEADYFRYFAKILCCFLADVGGPRSRSLSSFVLGASAHNPIFLRVSKDGDYEGRLAALGTQGFAEHGGLKFRFDSNKRWVQSIESSLSITGIRYDFWVQLRFLVKLELHLLFPELIQTALKNIVQD